LYTTIYKSKEPVRNVIRQLKMASEESFISGGHLAAFRRATAYVNTESAVQEYYSGYEAHISTKALEKNFDSEFDILAEKLSALAAKIFTKERLIISTTGNSDEKFETKLVEIIKNGESTAPVCNISPLGIRREGIIIPAQAAYAALGDNIFNHGEEICGSISVARAILSYGYLWGEVRVQGGAYGAGLIARNNGNLGFYSYRDPSPNRSVECFKKAGDFLRDFAKSGEDITNFIIGAVGDASPLTTPKLKGTLATMRYLRGIEYGDECRIRRELLDTGKTELLKIANIIDKISRTDAYCIVGGRDKLSACVGLLKLLEI